MPSDTPPHLQINLANAAGNSLMLLGQFQPLLHTLTLDDVQPLALNQMHDIGVLFQVNGPFAEQIPDLLTRSHSVEIEKFSAWVGWRQNDAASLLAGTPGGSSIALISLFLAEVWKAGELSLYDLSVSLLPPEKRICSPQQLASVSTVLSRKIKSIGFGTHLAAQGDRIRQAYMDQEEEIPNGLLETYSVESFNEMLVMLHRALTDDKYTLNCQGITGAAYTMAIITALCPDDTVITVQGAIIHDGTRRNVVIDIDEKYESQFFLLSKIKQNTEGEPVFLQPKKKDIHHRLDSALKWTGWLSDTLDLAFLKMGKYCTAGVKQACCDTIALAALTRRLGDPGRIYDPYFLLGENPHNRVRDSLRITTGLEPTFRQHTPEQAFKEFVLEISSAIFAGRPFCNCSSCVGLESDAERLEAEHFSFKRRVRKPGAHRLCKMIYFTRAMMTILSKGFYSLFVAAQAEDVAVDPALHTDKHDEDHERNLEFLVYGRVSQTERWQGLIPGIFGVLAQDVTVDRSKVGRCNYSVTMFPDHLLEPKLDLSKGLIFHLYDGLLYDDNQRVLKFIRSEDYEDSFQSFSRPGDTNWGDGRIPSTTGVPSSLTMAFKNKYDVMEIYTHIQWQNRLFERSFSVVLNAFTTCILADACHHEDPDGLDVDKPAVATGIAAPVSNKAASDQSLISIVMTRSNAEAQFFAMYPYGDRGQEKREYWNSILYQGPACINCAYDQALKYKSSLIVCS